jgi:hypothetical protein
VNRRDLRLKNPLCLCGHRYLEHNDGKRCDYPKAPNRTTDSRECECRKFRPKEADS